MGQPPKPTPKEFEMVQDQFDVMEVQGGSPVKMWTRGVPVDDRAREQLAMAARMPFIFKHVAAMPDVHVGIGATVGSVIPTKGAIIPAAVGRDSRGSLAVAGSRPGNCAARS